MWFSVYDYSSITASASISTSNLESITALTSTIVATRRISLTLFHMVSSSKKFHKQHYCTRNQALPQTRAIAESAATAVLQTRKLAMDGMLHEVTRKPHVCMYGYSHICPQYDSHMVNHAASVSGLSHTNQKWYNGSNRLQQKYTKSRMASTLYRNAHWVIPGEQISWQGRYHRACAIIAKLRFIRLA